MDERELSPAERAQPGIRALRPRDAATLIIIDRTSGGPKVLLGKRRLDVAFMPGMYVFPGGRVDRTDHTISVADELRPEETSRLLAQMKGVASPARARAIALAAVRETFEEAGLIVGAPAAGAARPRAEAWRAFFAAGFAPSLGRLRLIARAITPPGRPRRFDARFFCVDAEAISHRIEIGDGELSGLDWLSLDAARELDIPRITRVVLEDLAERIAGDALEDPAASVPFYYQRNGSFRRDLIR